MLRVVLACACVSGCMPPVVQSALVETNDMSATYLVLTSADGTTNASAAFRWESGMAAVLLDDGDSVSVDGIVLDTETESSEVYRTDVPAAPEHVFVLQRGPAAPIEHRVVTPTKFALTSGPFDGSYDLEATLSWTPVVADATVRVVALGTTAPCPSVTLADFLPDTGSFAFTGSDVRPAGEMPPSCTFTLSISRSERVDGAASPLSSVGLVGAHVDSTTLSLR